MNKYNSHLIVHFRQSLFLGLHLGLILLLSSLKISAAQSAPLIFSTFLGGDLADTAVAITTGPDGNIFLTGSTQSTLFPTARFADNHGVDLFVAKLSSDGSQLIYVLWFNATNAADVDEGFDIAVDSSGSAYVSGHTRSADFCTLFGTVPGYDTTYNDSGDGFLLKVKPDGSGLDYCTFIGGSDWDVATAVTLDAANNALISGATWSTDFPTTEDANQPTNAGLRDIFIARLDPTGTILTYASYWGGSGQEQPLGIASGTNSQLALTGWSNSIDLPTTADSFAPIYGGEFDGFLLQLTPDLNNIDYATYLGGSGEDRATAVTLDNDGAATISGSTRSNDFPTSPLAFQTSPSGAGDGFVLRLASDGRHLIYSTYLGGSDNDESLGLFVDTTGITTVTGTTNSTDFPTTPHAYAAAFAGEKDVFMVQISPNGQQLLYGSFLGGADSEMGTAVTSVSPHSFLLTGGTRSTDFPTTPNAYDTRFNGDYDVFVTRLSPVSEVLIAQVYLPLIIN